jgi:hypothetical protein
MQHTVNPTLAAPEPDTGLLHNALEPLMRQVLAITRLLDFLHPIQLALDFPGVFRAVDGEGARPQQESRKTPADKAITHSLPAGIVSRLQLLEIIRPIAAGEATAQLQRPSGNPVVQWQHVAGAPDSFPEYSHGTDTAQTVPQIAAESTADHHLKPHAIIYPGPATLMQQTVENISNNFLQPVSWVANRLPLPAMQLPVQLVKEQLSQPRLSELPPAATNVHRQLHHSIFHLSPFGVAAPETAGNSEQLSAFLLAHDAAAHSNHHHPAHRPPPGPAGYAYPGGYRATGSETPIIHNNPPPPIQLTIHTGGSDSGLPQLRERIEEALLEILNTTG